jgi:DNA-binding SARP family transcriptional activator
MSVEVRLLGPVELRGDDGPVDPGPAKRRALLAALALEANRPVPLNRLTDLLWTGRPPASAIANIRNHVAALRRTS